MDSMTPDLVILVALLLGAAGCLFVYVRRRLGPWPALLMTTLLLFLGPAWQDLLWPFQVGFVGSSLCGLAALLALENGSRRWDAAACALLVTSAAFSSLGLAFAVAAAVDVLQRHRERGWGRAYVAGAPLLFYAGWYLGWGHEAENQLSADNVLASPGYVVEGLTASLDSLLALGTVFDEAVGRSKFGLPLLIALVALAAYGLYRRRSVYPGLWPVLAATATFWFLAAFNTIPGREAYSSRYLYVGGLLFLLVASNLLKGVRINRWGLAVAGVLTIAIAGFNLVPLREGRDFFAKETVLTRADLAAVEIAADTVDPRFTLPPEISGTPFLNEIEAGEYLRAVSEYGSPAYTPAELAAAPAEGREHADLVLAHALPLNIETGLAGSAGGDGRCRTLGGPAGSGPESIPLSPGTTTIRLRAGGSGAIRLRRFATGEYPLAAEDLPGGSTTKLFIPRDRSPRPWHLRVEAPQGATVCG
ncbi:MAG TPA: hypothetical protein VN179_01110, partial [Solirubrobacterales bacterium]|nr:hypothetical protein [Solirubrobacterales bacterium]